MLSKTWQLLENKRKWVYVWRLYLLHMKYESSQSPVGYLC